LPDGLPGTADDFLVEGNPAAPISLVNAVRTGHPFLVDIAATANPFDPQTNALLTRVQAIGQPKLVKNNTTTLASARRSSW